MTMALLSPGPRVLVASQIDYQQVTPHRRAVYMNHGAGQSYGGDPDPGVSRASSYAGGDNQDRTDLFLVPGPDPAERCMRRYPAIPVVEIGCPALDGYLGRPRFPSGSHPVVALAWHWENQLCPETRSALPHFLPGLAALSERYEVIGHGHPRARGFLEPAYERLRIPWADYETVMERASVLCMDNSSIGFEAAAAGIPVVWMTPPWYRRSVSHGLRFWDCVGLGIEVTRPEDLVGAVASSLGARADWDRARSLRVLSGIYSHLDGASAHRAAAAILALEGSGLETSRPLAEVAP